MTKSNTRTIARNTGWYGLETAISFIVGLSTSIAIARTLGPTKMGYIIYVIWVSTVVSSLGGMGIPATTRKYMAEFLGMGNRGTAKFIYLRTLGLQVGLATVATAGLLLWILRDAAGEYKLASALIVLSIWPAMVNAIPSQANVATEELSANLPASVISILVYSFMVAATVMLHWGVVGFGAATLAMRSVDFLVRIFPTTKRILQWPSDEIHPADLSRRMMAFAWQSVASMIVALIVWDRSEFFLLKRFCPDIRQVSYYSVAFSMAERLLVSSTIFGSATGATIFAQFGRDKSRLPEITAATFRYLALTSIPLHIIASALAFPALLLLYGRQYSDAAMVVTLAPLLCMPKAFMAPVQSLLQSTEQQSYVIGSTILAGVIDLSVAWALIPAHGAVGACIGSGAAQVAAIGLMWAIGIRLYKINLPYSQIAKITSISALAALTAHFVARDLTPLWAILGGGAASLVVLFALSYCTRVLEPTDGQRLQDVAKLLPAPFVGPAVFFISHLIRPASAEQDTADRCSAAFPSTSPYTEMERKPSIEIPRLIDQLEMTYANRPTISVVIPAYNAERFLRRCLESVSAQTLKPDEVIVIDDGSTDSTAELAMELGARTFSGPNRGISSARNTGIRFASSEWIALLDTDDLWDPEKLERQVALIHPDTVLIYTGIRKFDERGVREEASAVAPDVAATMLRYCNPVSPSSVILRRSTVIQAGGFREGLRSCEDWGMWVQLKKFGRFDAVLEPLTNYYVHPASLSANPKVMLDGLAEIMNPMLLEDLRGVDRYLWRQRILATQLASAGLIARENGLDSELTLMIRSLCAWPSPLWQTRRFAMLAVSMREAIRSSVKIL